MEYRASFIIPAFNEELRIRGLLGALTNPRLMVNVQFSSSAMAALIKQLRFPESTQESRSSKSKRQGSTSLSMRRSTCAEQTFPRFYCDADFQIDTESIVRMIDFLSVDDAIVGGPLATFAYTTRPWAVQKFYEAPHMFPFSRIGSRPIFRVVRYMELVEGRDHDSAHSRGFARTTHSSTLSLRVRRSLRFPGFGLNFYSIVSARTHSKRDEGVQGESRT